MGLYGRKVTSVTSRLRQKKAKSNHKNIVFSMTYCKSYVGYVIFEKNFVFNFKKLFKSSMCHDPRNLIKSSTEGISQAIEDLNKIITKLLRLTGNLELSNT